MVTISLIIIIIILFDYWVLLLNCTRGRMAKIWLYCLISFLRFRGVSHLPLGVAEGDFSDVSGVADRLRIGDDGTREGKSK